MSEHPYTPTEAAEWLCRGGPCVESGDRCKVLAENCCLCVYSGNLIVRQSAENKKLLCDVEDSDKALDKYWKENKQLIAEVSHYRAALGFVGDLAIKVGAPNVEKLVLSALATGEEIAMRRVLERVSTEQDGINDRGSDEYANPVEKGLAPNE